MRLFSSLAMSILLYNSELWEDNPVHVKWLNVFYMRAMRRITGHPRAPVEGVQRLSNSEVRAKYKQPSIQALLFRWWLGYVASLVRQPLLPLLGLLEPHCSLPSSWSQLILEDLRTRWKVVPALREFEDPYVVWPRWQSVMVHRPAVWNKLVREASLDSYIFKSCLADSVEFSCLDHKCPDCDRAFASAKAVATHRMRVHGHRKEVASHIATDCLSCPACSKVFVSHRMLLDHAQYRSKSCLAAIRLMPVIA